MSSGIACTFTGQVRRAPELRRSSRGVAWCRLDVEVGEAPEVQSVGVIAFAGRAERVCQQFREGDPIHVEGTLSLRHWTGRDGTQRSALTVTSTKIGAPPADVGGHRARHADAETTVGLEG